MKVTASESGARIWANGEFDLCAALFRSWSLGGAQARLEQAAAATTHLLAIDLPARGGRGERRGIPWRHDEDHGIGGVQDLGHAWLEGLLLGGRIRGDPLALDAAFGMADALADARRDPRREPELERSLAWPVIALAAAAAECGGVRYDEALIRRGSDLLDAFDFETGRWDLSTRRRLFARDPEMHVWLGAGLMGEAVLALGQASPRVRARLGSPSPERVARALVAAIWSQGWNADDRCLFARVSGDGRGGRGKLRGVAEGYAVTTLLRLATLARDSGGRTQALQHLRRRRDAAWALDEERWWTDWCLGARALRAPQEQR